MESKITISFDYEAKEPFIKIHYKHSDDERDRMVKAFLELNTDVSFTKFQYEKYDNGSERVISIRPISFERLPEELKTMKAWVDYVQSETFPKQVLKAVSSISPFFREWLQKEGIYFETDDANGSTLISGKVDLFNLGVEWGKLCAKSDVHIE